MQITAPRSDTSAAEYICAQAWRAPADRMAAHSADRRRTARRRIPVRAATVQVGLCSWSVNFLPCAVGSDIGECPLQPDIQLVARMTVIGDYVFRGRSQKNLSAALR